MLVQHFFPGHKRPVHLVGSPAAVFTFSGPADALGRARLSGAFSRIHESFPGSYGNSNKTQGPGGAGCPFRRFFAPPEKFTFMAAPRRSYSERLVCQKFESFLQKFPFVPKGWNCFKNHRARPILKRRLPVLNIPWNPKDPHGGHLEIHFGSLGNHKQSCEGGVWALKPQFPKTASNRRGEHS